MPTTECATEIAQPNTQSDASQPDCTPPAAAQASRLLKGLLLGFAATVTIGLGLASWYVGVRIVAADEIAPSSAPIAAPALAPRAVAKDSMAETFWYTVPSANLYLQTAGLGPQQDAGFVRSLQAEGFKAHVQVGDEGHSRILIGPFPTQAEMERGRRKLQSVGVLSVETAY
jgi:cell division protein FtsN